MATKHFIQRLHNGFEKGSALLLTLLLLSTLSLFGVLSLKLVHTQILISANFAASKVAFTDNENNLTLAVQFIRQHIRKPATFDWNNYPGVYDRTEAGPIKYSAIISAQIWNNKETVKSAKYSRYLIEFIGRVYFTRASSVPISNLKPNLKPNLKSNSKSKSTLKPAKQTLQVINIFRITSRTRKRRGIIKTSQILYAQKSLAKSANRNKRAIKLKKGKVPIGILSWTDL